jgi:hypothetical protein
MARCTDYNMGFSEWQVALHNRCHPARGTAYKLTRPAVVCCLLASTWQLCMDLLNRMWVSLARAYVHYPWQQLQGITCASLSLCLPELLRSWRQQSACSAQQAAVLTAAPPKCGPGLREPAADDGRRKGLAIYLYRYHHYICCRSAGIRVARNVTV